MIRNQNRKSFSWALLALLITPFLYSCGGGGVSGLMPLRIIGVEFSPSQIPAPTAGTPTAFEIRWQVKNEGYHMTVSSASGNFVEASCGSCNNQLVTLSCTSTLSATDPNSRVLSCASTDPQVTVTSYDRTYPAGTIDWTFYAHMIDGKGFALPGEHDIAYFAIGLQ